MSLFSHALKFSGLAAIFAAAPVLAEDVVPEAAYTHQVFVRIGSEAVYPRKALVLSEEGVVTMAVAVDGQGNLTGISIIQSSGVPEIDRSAIQAAKDAAPYPAPAADTVVKGRVRYSL